MKQLIANDGYCFSFPYEKFGTNSTVGHKNSIKMSISHILEIKLEFSEFGLVWKNS